MTLAARAAFDAYTFGKTRVFPESRMETFRGLSGDEETFACSVPVVMELTFEGPEIVGRVRRKNMKTPVPVTGKEDARGHILLKEWVFGGHGADASVSHYMDVNYVFKGTRDEQGIRGVWEKGHGKKAFAFFVTPVKQKKEPQ